MNHPQVPLEEVADFVNGAAFKPEDWGEDGLPIIRIQNLTDSGKPFNYTERVVPDKLVVNPGDLLVSWSATLGVFQWNGPKGLLNQHIFRVLPNDEVVDKNYLKHTLGQAINDMERHLHGATMKHVNRGEFLGTRIPLPPLEEQRRIAAILDKAHSTKRLAIAASDRFESLSLAIFEELFGSGAWPTATLEDVTSRITNGYVGPTRDIYVDEGIPYLLARHVKNGRLYYCGSPKVSAAFNEKNKKSRLKEGDVLLVQSGHIGSSCVVPREHDGHNCHAMIVLSPIRDLLLGQYLSLLFRTQRLQRLFKAIQTGITLPHLNCRDVRRIQIPLPPIEKQIWLSERISTLSGGSALAVDQINLISILERSLTDQLLGSK